MEQYSRKPDIWTERLVRRFTVVHLLRWECLNFRINWNISVLASTVSSIALLKRWNIGVVFIACWYYTRGRGTVRLCMVAQDNQGESLLIIFID